MEFRSNIVGNLWGQEILLLLEQWGPVLLAIRDEEEPEQDILIILENKEKQFQVTCEQTTLSSTSLPTWVMEMI